MTTELPEPEAWRTHEALVHDLEQKLSHYKAKGAAVEAWVEKLYWDKEHDCLYPEPILTGTYLLSIEVPQDGCITDRELYPIIAAGWHLQSIHKFYHKDKKTHTLRALFSCSKDGWETK